MLSHQIKINDFICVEKIGRKNILFWFKNFDELNLELVKHG